MNSYSHVRVTLAALLSLAGMLSGCAATVEDAQDVEGTEEALYGAGDSVLTVVKQNIKFNGSTAPQFGMLGLTAFTTAPARYTVALAPNGPSATACPPFHGGDTIQYYNVDVATRGVMVNFPAPYLDAPASRGTCTLKTSIVFFGQPTNFFGQPQISIAYQR
jgi:hypothetical protein